jgi:hypothetical protein
LKSFFSATLIILLITGCSQKEIKQPGQPEKIKVLLDNTTPLIYERANRLPLYLWPAIDPGVTDEENAVGLISELNKRGIGIVCSWKADNIEKSLSSSLLVAKAQKKLGLPVNIDATALLYSFFNGDPRTAHIDRSGNPFFDESFGKHKMGCPFSIDYRKNEIRERVRRYVSRYSEEGIPVDFIFTDWEIDGPLEVNRAFDASKKCTTCCRYLGNEFTFVEFQKTMREMRSYLLNYCYSSPVLSHFPRALVGNYAVYPNDGYRYWYDYFEYYVDGQPYKSDRKAKYRQWYNDFPATGFTFAMPVVYPWEPIFNWYDFKNTDYRWFCNMLLVASNAGKSTPQNIPVISFVHWHTVFVSGKPDPAVKQMSKECYQELLWHMLLRGTDTFFMWCEEKESPDEVKLVHQVYAAAQKYGNFLEHGLPVTFDVPCEPGTVVSGLALGDSVLVRRTDFGDEHKPVELLAGTRVISVDYAPGICRVISLK